MVGQLNDGCDSLGLVRSRIVHTFFFSPSLITTLWISGTWLRLIAIVETIGALMGSPAKKSPAFAAKSMSDSDGNS
jgi:hypothetical protein